MALSLAPLRYRAVNVERGGPIQTLSVGAGELFGGRPCFLASAFLRDDIRPKRRARLALYSDEEGSGTDLSRAVACYKAVSEAIERWAFYASVDGPESGRMRFDLEPTTTGMAAFPGLTTGGAREIAYSEAVERWAVLEWWRGRLAARPRRVPWEGVGAVEILTPFQGPSVAVLWTRGRVCSGAAYGFSGGGDFSRAAGKALVELSRNQRVLAYFQSRAPGPAVPLESSIERRLVRFNGEAGWADFEERLAASGRLAEPSGPAPDPLVDAELRGPWSGYATVWRVLFEHPSGPDDRSSDGVFRF